MSASKFMAAAPAELGGLHPPTLCLHCASQPRLCWVGWESVETVSAKDTN